MTVTVIIPSYNHSAFIESAIMSVLNQTYSDIQLIVLDDGSKDSSPSLLSALQKKFNFELVLKENEGVCKTLNRGIAMAKGQLITFLASDDIMPSNRVTEQVAAMNEHKDADVIAGAVRIINADNKEVSTRIPNPLGYLEFEQMLKRNQVMAPTAVFRKATFEKFGLYNPEFVIEDYYMWLKILSQQGKILNTNHIWAYYRVTDVNQEQRFRWYYKGYTQVLSQYLPDQKVESSLNHYNLVFVAKMIFLKGMQFIKEEGQEFAKISLGNKGLLYVVAVLPQEIRHKILRFLLVNY